MGKRKDNLRRKSSSDEEDDILCPCGKASGSSYWILCDGCETWYHGKCAKFTEKETSMVDKFYCEKCIARNPSYTTTYKSGFVPKKSVSKDSDTKDEANSSQSVLKLSAYEPEKYRELQRMAQAQALALNNKAKSNKRCGNCSGCFRTANCDICTNCYTNKECLRRICVNRTEEPESNSSASEDSPNHQNPKVVEYIEKQKDIKLLYGKDKVKPRLSNSQDVVHCHGPQCIKQSRPGSKYCSHECGLNRSRNRLLVVLPVRVNDYLQEQPVMFTRLQTQIEESTKEQINLEDELTTVSDTRTFFNDYINRLVVQDSKCEKKKEKPVKENKRASEATEESGSNFNGRCPICGQVSNSYGALQKHIMKCYFRIEKRTCFVGPYAQVQNPENIICDAYCKQQNAYCKRLQVLCFDHYKGFLTAKESVCGAPFAIYENGDIMNMKCPIDKMAILAKGQCAMTKDACDRHHNWGLALLGSLDNYRLTVVRRIEQVKIRIAQLREQFNRRYDVSTLMQNYRIDDSTDKYGMPKKVDFVNSLPEYIEKKLSWTDEVAEINKRLQKRLDDRYAAAEKKKEEEKAQLEAMKKLKGKNKRQAKKKNPPAKRGRIANTPSAPSTRPIANQENRPIEVDQQRINLSEGPSAAPPPQVSQNIITNDSPMNFIHPPQIAMDIH